MCRIDIQPLQQLEELQIQHLQAWDQKSKIDGSAHELTAVCEQHANQIVKCWWELADRLIAKYSDVNPPPSTPQNSSPVAIGYPSEWLGLTNYRDGPISYDMKL